MTDRQGVGIEEEVTIARVKKCYKTCLNVFSLKNARMRFRMSRRDATRKALCYDQRVFTVITGQKCVFELCHAIKLYSDITVFTSSFAKMYLQLVDLQI